MKGEIRKYLVVSENKNTTYQSSGGAAKAAHRRKFVAANVYSKKEARHLVNNPAFYLKELEKKGIKQTEEIMKIKTEIK